jgi:hypothetical protein
LGDYLTMPKNRTFHNNSHADAYLSGSIIRINDYPVYVHKVVDGFIYYTKADQKGGTTDRIALDDQAIDMNPMPLGFLSVQKESDPCSMYLKRGPYRQWKIGLTNHNCIVSNPFKNGGVTSYIPSHHILHSKWFVDTVFGRYVDPKTAHRVSNKAEELKVVPFGRRFAVCKDYLLHKDLGEPVGTATNGKPELHEDFAYLDRQLNEDLNACGNC